MKKALDKIKKCVEKDDIFLSNGWSDDRFNDRDAHPRAGYFELFSDIPLVLIFLLAPIFAFIFYMPSFLFVNIFMFEILVIVPINIEHCYKTIKYHKCIKNNIPYMDLRQCFRPHQ